MLFRSGDVFAFGFLPWIAYIVIKRHDNLSVDIDVRTNNFAKNKMFYIASNDVSDHSESKSFGNMFGKNV